MTVFKGYLKMIKRNLGTALLYFSIFIGITLLMNMATTKDGVQGFSSKECDVVVVDLDKSELSKELVAFLKEKHHVSMEKDDKARLAEELYYATKSVVLRIEKGFEEKALAGEDGIKLTNRPGSYHGIYLEWQINRYLGNVMNYHAVGYSIKESCQRVAKLKESKVSIEDVNGNGGEIPGYGQLFGFLPYLFLCVFGEVLGRILFAFRERKVKNRLMASSVPLMRQNGESILAFFVVGIVVYGLCIIIGIIIYGSDFLTTSNLVWYLLNGFLAMMAALEIAFLIGLFAKTETHVNIVTTSVSLGVSFLCGVFVPLSVMTTQIKNIAKFLPVYWYETVNNLLVDYADISGTVRRQLFHGLGIQVLFLLALAGIGMTVVKYQQQER